MSQTGSQTRRMFLGRSARAGAGLMLLPVIPPWVLQALRHTRAYRERSFFTMGAVATISAYGESTRQIDQAVNKVIEEFGRLDRLLSVYNPASELSRINACAGREAVRVHPEVFHLLKHMQEWSRDTEGAFDMTVEPLMRLWGFRGKERNRPPSDREIRLALEGVGPNHVQLDQRDMTVGLDHPAALIDSGGWGVGYAVDRAVEILKSEGIESAFVNHSGDAFALGAPPEEVGGQGWQVAIPDPLSSEQMMFSTSIRDRAVSTSGNYRIFRMEGDERIGHILDPHTGFPAGRTISMTVFSARALQSDVLSTALVTLPPEEWHRTADQHRGVNLIGVLKDGTVHRTDGGVVEHQEKPKE